MNEKENSFTTFEEINKFLTLEVLYQLKLDLVAKSFDIRVYDDEVALIMKTGEIITKMPGIINSCSRYKIYAMDDMLVFQFFFQINS